MTAIPRRRAPLIIANPTESDSEESGSDDPHRPFSPANPFRNIDPPTPIVLGPNSSQSSIVPDDVSGSSRSSPAPDTTPPRTPGQPLPPVNIAGDGLDAHLSPKDRPYHHHHNPHHDRDPDIHSIGRAPLHVRRPSSGPTNSQSPILSISHSYNNPLSPTDEPRIIMATADSDMFIKVNITSAQTGEAIRELIFSALQIADEDQLGFSLFQTELGESALGEPLSNDQLSDMCSHSADRKGTLKFIIQRSSAQVYVRPDIRALPIPPPPTTVPPLPKSSPLAVVPPSFRPGTRNGTRPSPQSQHDTASSTSDRRNEYASGAHDQSLSDDVDAHETRRRPVHGQLRTQLSHQQLSRPSAPPTPPQPPAPRRPIVGIYRGPKQGISPIDNCPPGPQRGLSPMRSSPGGHSNGTSDSSSSYQNIHTLHQLPHMPSVAPLQIERRGSITPTPPMYGASLSPPSSRDGVAGMEGWHHGRRPSETAAERERLLEQSEVLRERQALQNRRERERERREREKRDKEHTQQIRSEETQRWQQQQAIFGGGDSSTSQSPSDTLSPGSAWFGERSEGSRSRPGTTGGIAARGAFPTAERDRDRPSTAQPNLRPQPYLVRGPPPTLVPGGVRPNTASSTGSGAGGTRTLETPRQMQPAYRGQQTLQGGGASTTMMQQLETRTVDRGQAVPPNWMVGWRAHDGRTAPLQQNRLPLTAGSKSMDNLRNQYFSGSSANSKTYGLKLQTGPRRLPTPSSQRTAPNNYGGPSDYSTVGIVSPQYSSPTATLPYHDQPVSRSGMAQPFGATGRAGGGQNSGTNTPSDYIARGGGAAPWREERPRSPQRASPKLSGFRHEMELREPRPPYVSPPGRADNIVRGEHAGSFGQAALNLSPSLGAGRSSSDKAPTLPSLEDSSERLTESTLQPTDHQWILKILDGEMSEMPPQSGSEESTVVPGGRQRTPTSRPQQEDTISIEGPTDSEEEEDSEESESEAGTLWQPVKKKRVSRVPSLHPIQTGIPAIPPVPPIPPPQPPYTRKASRNALSPGNVNRHSSFTKRDSITWAFRPPPEDMYERLEEFFPDHDLDKPVIDAAPSGGSSPTQAEHPPPPAFPPQSRTRHKKSIRVVVSDRKSKMGSPTAQNMSRKRSTKLWGSRVEEVTPAQAKGGVLSAAPDSPPGAPNPKPIFKWAKGELIGKGTYGRVYLALNATTGEMIAVKQVELPRTFSDQDDGRQLQVVEALISESDTLKDLDHPNVVQYLGFEQSSEFLSIFLEYVPGGSIGGCLRKHGKFDHDVVRSFTSQMLAGLEYLHSRGVLHRDLKADNILLDTSGVCKISDFGISKRSADIYDNDTALTAMQGSIFWMAPEVLHNNKQGYNAKIDIWSLGCVVLEMWAGRRPWNQEDIVAVMFKLGAEREAPPVPDDVELDAVEDDFRRQCFAINPNDRPTAAELRKHTFLEPKPGWVFTGIK